MGLANRKFLLDEHDGLYRLPTAKFEQMLRDPTSHRILRFAGARARMTDLIVELADRQPLRVVQITFPILTFTAEAFLNLTAFEQQRRSRAEVALAPVIAQPSVPATVVGAASRFVAEGGRWAPSARMKHLIQPASLGRVKCPQL